MTESEPRGLSGDLEHRPSLDDVTIVIPTLGRPVLEECLYWIADGSHWPAKVVVVDQSSSEQVSGWVRQLREIGIDAEHVGSQQRGRSAGINRGLERVRTRFVAVTDDDCFVRQDWLARMVEHLRQRPDAIVTGSVELAGDEEVAFSTVSSSTPVVYHRPMLKVHPLIGGNMGVAMENVHRIGAFDEHPSLSSAEDSDYGYRALRSGVPIVYDPTIVLRHFHWRDTRQRRERYLEYSRSQGAFFGKHLLRGDLLILAQVLRALVRAPIRWVRGHIGQNRDMIDRGRADLLGLLPGIVAGIRRRKRR